MSLVVVFAALGLSAGVFAQGEGQVGCPCVGGNPNLLIPFESELYDQNYGTNCARHDYGREYCGPGDAWCGKSWCYVDANCVAKLPKNKYVSHAQPSVIFPKSNLMWSYETCGDENLYSGPWKHEFKTVTREECRCTGSNEGLVGPLQGSDVGTSCRAWDANNDYCRPGHSTWKESNAGWCPEKWCYVQENCWSRKNRRSPRRISRRSIYENNPNVQLWYSYQNCGSPDNFPFTDTPWEYSFAQCANRPPVDVYFLVDSSDSVAGYWNGIQEGVSTFIGGLDPEKGDRAGLILFGGTTRNTEDKDVETIHTLTSDIAGLEQTAKTMARLIPGGKSTHHTWTYTAINHTLEAYKDDEVHPGSHPYIVLVTDGAPNPNHLENPCDPNINFAHPRSEILELGIKTLIFEIGEHFDTLDCLVDNPDEDIVVIPDAMKFFDGIEENVFCNSLITDEPTSVPTIYPTYSPTFPTPIPTPHPTPDPTPIPTPSPTPMPTGEPTEVCVMKCFEQAECTSKTEGNPLPTPPNPPALPSFVPTSAPFVDAPDFCSGVTQLSGKGEHSLLCRGFNKQRGACESSGCYYSAKNGKCKATSRVVCADLSGLQCCKFQGCRIEGEMCTGSFRGYILL